MIPINDLNRGIARSDDVATALKRVLQSGHWIHGPEHKAFEHDFAAFLNVGFTFGVASGTDALEIALRAVGCHRDSTVITVANAGGYTSVASASIGCKVIYCDVDPVKLLMDPRCLAPLLSEEITAVVVTHLYGNVAPIKEIKEMCDLYGIKVIEDCAQALGATEFGVRVGTIGHVGTFSFYPTKNLGAIGDGGALATNDPEIAERITQLRQYGWTSKYKIDLPGGMNSRLDEIQAAVLRVGLPKLDNLNQKRLKIIERYSEAIRETSLKLITSHHPGSVAHLAVLEVPKHLDRNKFRSHLKDNEIQTDIHYPVLDIDQKGLVPSGVATDQSNSRRASDLILTIPLFPELTDTEITRIALALRNYN
jgi:dTDP-3-amino-2,3,6-trideoxy-4-keto-D-glucose/dTDP-3-amino-3,4,6-trideoxy-alpha-D-glucose/dTDP-2,6-dideoxy-D-kanosamine transaminase